MGAGRRRLPTSQGEHKCQPVPLVVPEPNARSRLGPSPGFGVGPRDGPSGGTPVLTVARQTSGRRSFLDRLLTLHPSRPTNPGVPYPSHSGVPIHASRSLGPPWLLPGSGDGNTRKNEGDSYPRFSSYPDLFRHRDPRRTQTKDPAGSRLPSTEYPIVVVHH